MIPGWKNIRQARLPSPRQRMAQPESSQWPRLDYPQRQQHIVGQYEYDPIALHGVQETNPSGKKTHDQHQQFQFYHNQVMGNYGTHHNHQQMGIPNMQRRLPFNSAPFHKIQPPVPPPLPTEVPPPLPQEQNPPQPPPLFFSKKEWWDEELERCTGEEKNDLNCLVQEPSFLSMTKIEQLECWQRRKKLKSDEHKKESDADSSTVTVITKPPCIKTSVSNPDNSLIQQATIVDEWTPEKGKPHESLQYYQEQIIKLSNQEKTFQKQYGEWQNQFKEWKDKHKHHPNKSQFVQYEQQWVTWQAQMKTQKEQNHTNMENLNKNVQRIQEYLNQNIKKSYESYQQHDVNNYNNVRFNSNIHKSHQHNLNLLQPRFPQRNPGGHRQPFLNKTDQTPNILESRQPRLSNVDKNMGSRFPGNSNNIPRMKKNNKKHKKARPNLTGSNAIEVNHNFSWNRMPMSKIVDQRHIHNLPGNSSRNINISTYSQSEKNQKKHIEETENKSIFKQDYNGEKDFSDKGSDYEELYLQQVQEEDDLLLKEFSKPQILSNSSRLTSSTLSRQDDSQICSTAATDHGKVNIEIGGKDIRKNNNFEEHYTKHLKEEFQKNQSLRSNEKAIFQKEINENEDVLGKEKSMDKCFGTSSAQTQNRKKNEAESLASVLESNKNIVATNQLFRGENFRKLQEQLETIKTISKASTDSNKPDAVDESKILQKAKSLSNFELKNILSAVKSVKEKKVDSTNAGSSIQSTSNFDASTTNTKNLSESLIDKVLLSKPESNLDNLDRRLGLGDPLLNLMGTDALLRLSSGLKDDLFLQEYLSYDPLEQEILLQILQDQEIETKRFSCQSAGVEQPSLNILTDEILAQEHHLQDLYQGQKLVPRRTVPFNYGHDQFLRGPRPRFLPGHEHFREPRPEFLRPASLPFVGGPRADIILRGRHNPVPLTFPEPGNFQGPIQRFDGPRTEFWDRPGYIHSRMRSPNQVNRFIRGPRLGLRPPFLPSPNIQHLGGERLQHFSPRPILHTDGKDNPADLENRLLGSSGRKHGHPIDDHKDNKRHNSDYNQPYHDIYDRDKNVLSSTRPSRDSYDRPHMDSQSRFIEPNDRPLAFHTKPNIDPKNKFKVLNFNEKQYTDTRDVQLTPYQEGNYGLRKKSIDSSERHSMEPDREYNDQPKRFFRDTSPLNNQHYEREVIKDDYHDAHRDIENIKQRRKNLDDKRTDNEIETDRLKRERSLERLRTNEKELMEREKALLERERELREVLPMDRNEEYNRRRFPERSRSRSPHGHRSSSYSSKDIFFKKYSLKNSSQVIKKRNPRSASPRKSELKQDLCDQKSAKKILYEDRFHERYLGGHSYDHDENCHKQGYYDDRRKGEQREKNSSSLSAHDREISKIKSRSNYSADLNSTEVRKISSTLSIPQRIIGHHVTANDLFKMPERLKRPKKIVIILRGIPGCGKTYMAKEIRDKEISFHVSPRVLSLDDYFMVEVEKLVKDSDTGKLCKKKVFEYEYEDQMLECYRNNLFRSFKKTLEDGYFSFVILDAVNQKINDFQDSYNIAKQLSFEVFVAEITADVHLCSRRNIHNRSLEDIQKIEYNWEPTPSYMNTLDLKQPLQGSEIQEVEMGDISDNEDENFKINQQKQQSKQTVLQKSKWENESHAAQLDKLDGLKKKTIKKSMEDFLSVTEDYISRTSAPGKKRVRWADMNERQTQQRMRDVGFVVGGTDWSRMMDDSHADKALNRTKFI